MAWRSEVRVRGGSAGGAAASLRRRVVPWHGRDGGIGCRHGRGGQLAGGRSLDAVTRACRAQLSHGHELRAARPNEVIRAVFSPTITLVELQTMLDEAQLRIVSGPTEAGVYSLAANSRRPVSSLAGVAAPACDGALRREHSAEHRARRFSMMRWWVPRRLDSRGLRMQQHAGAHRVARARRSGLAVTRSLHHCGSGQ